MLPKKSVELWLSGRALQGDLWTFPEGPSVLQECGRERQGFPSTLCLSPGLHLSFPALGSFLRLRLVRVIAFSSPAVTLIPNSAGRGWKRREMDLVTVVRLLGARVGKKPAICDHVGAGAGPGDAHKV